MFPESDTHVLPALPRLRLFWGAAICSCLALAVLGVLVSPVVSPTPTAGTGPLAAAFAALGVLGAALTLLLDRAILAPAQVASRVTLPDPGLALRYLLAGHLAVWSLSGLPALLGFAQLLLDGSRGTLLGLCAVSLATLAVLMPTRARITARIEAVLRAR